MAGFYVNCYEFSSYLLQEIKESHACGVCIVGGRIGGWGIEGGADRVVRNGSPFRPTSILLMLCNIIHKFSSEPLIINKYYNN
jgi:hypothetical protein